MYLTGNVSVPRILYDGKDGLLLRNEGDNLLWRIQQHLDVRIEM
jgi:hypothetical protein